MNVAPPKFADLGGRKLAYDEARPADPSAERGTILLLTGLGSKRLGWYNQLPVFGQTYRTLAIDHRGTGDSDDTETEYTPGDLADDAAALLRALGVARAHVVGISLGGFTALNFALRHPDQLDHLVLVSTSAGGATHTQPAPEIVALLMPAPEVEVGERAIRNYSKIMAAEFVAAHPEALEHIAEVARYRPQTPEAYGRQLRAALAQDVADQLGRITAPTLVIHGDVDPLVPPPNGARLAANIPGARHLIYPGVGHIPIIERADTFNRDVLAFLEA